MSLVARSLRNILRSPLRTGAVMAVLAVSVGLAPALVASVFPAWHISRVKPAEVLRNE